MNKPEYYNYSTAYVDGNPFINNGTIVIDKDNETNDRIVNQIKRACEQNRFINRGTINVVFRANKNGSFIIGLILGCILTNLLRLIST